MSQPDETPSAARIRRPKRLKLDRAGSGRVIEYVGGSKPYLWIGGDGEFFGSVSVEALRAFLKGRKS